MHREAVLQKARCFLLGERAAVLELEPPLSLESQKRIWSLATRLREYPNVSEVIPGMNNITLLLSVPETEPVEVLDKLQQWWEESESVQPEVLDRAVWRDHFHLGVVLYSALFPRYHAL